MTPDKVENALDPIKKEWEKFVLSGQSITIGSGQNCICIPAWAIQFLAQVMEWKPFDDRDS